LDLLGSGVAWVHVDVAYERAALGEAQVENWVSGFENAFVVSQNVFDQILGFHHTLPPVLHLLFEHLHLEFDTFLHEHVDFVQSSLKFGEFGLVLVLLVAELLLQVHALLVLLLYLFGQPHVLFQQDFPFALQVVDYVHFVFDLWKQLSDFVVEDHLVFETAQGFLCFGDLTFHEQIGELLCVFIETIDTGSDIV